MDATQDVGAIAEAVKSTADLVKDLADKPHPILEAWKMFRLIRKLTNWCKENHGVAVEDVVGAACDQLPEVTRTYLIHIVKVRLSN